MKKLERYTSYKDSGIHWLRKIPKEWEIKKLKFNANIETGNSISDHRKSDYENIEESAYSYISTKDINYEYSTINYNNGLKIPLSDKNFKVSNPNTTLICIEGGSAGKKIAFNHHKICYVNKLASIQSNKKNNSKYLYYLIKSNIFKKQFELSMNGLIGGVSTSIMKNFELVFANIKEQENIVSYLDTQTTRIDNLISQKEKLLELLKEQKQITINEVVTKGLNKEVEFVDSGVEWIGEIPKDWEITKVKNIFKLIIDPAPKANNEELLSIYTDIGVKPRKELAEKGNKASTTDGYWIVKKGDFIVNKLLAWMGAIGLSEYEGVTSPAYDILRAKKDIAGRYYHELFRLKVFSQEMKKHSRGIMDMRLRLYFDKFGDILITYPSYEEQVRIVEYIEIQTTKIDKAIELQLNYISKLKEYKATLIDSVVTGKVRVS
jgi:type I restriction enzyme S subunit